MATRNQINGEQLTWTCPAALCPLPSWSRTFTNADALLEHARQNRAQHPLCTTCIRVFKDTAALEQHVEAKHVVICQPCNRKYKSQSAIDQHWRSSGAHPNCPVCGAGTADMTALAEHVADAHPKVRCCGELLRENDLDAHYLTSRNHPTCDKCNIGFASELEYAEHNSQLHAELQCKVCAEQFPTSEALQAHTGDPSSHRRCEFCSAEFKETSALVEHYTETHLSPNDLQDAPSSVIEVSTRSPTPPMNRPYASPRPTPSAVVGGGRTATTPAYPPVPPSRAGTSTSASGSDIASASDLYYYSPQGTGTFTPLPGLGDSSSRASHSHSHSPYNNNRPTPVRSQSGFSSDAALSDYTTGTAVHRHAPAAMTPAQLARAFPSPAAHTPPRALSPSSSYPLPSPIRSMSSQAVGPVTPVRNGAINASSSQPNHHHQQQQQQQQQRQLPQPPSSGRSRGSVAETPSGDLANFHLLKGSPLQSVVDFDTPTPSPRTPSASPADHQAFQLASRAGAPYFPLADGRRFLQGSGGISPSFARAQRAAAAIPEARSSFYCRVCQLDPCREITATACGHVFCNACIVDEVRENARCPVCNAAVLLFALLKLDVSQL